jgi:hypothetical protein
VQSLEWTFLICLLGCPAGQRLFAQFVLP